MLCPPFVRFVGTGEFLGILVFPMRFFTLKESRTVYHILLKVGPGCWPAILTGPNKTILWSRQSDLALLVIRSSPE